MKVAATAAHSQPLAAATSQSAATANQSTHPAPPFTRDQLPWLAIRDVEDKRARQRASEKDLLPNDRRAAARLVEGATVQGWRQALGASPCTTPDRLAAYLN